MATYYLITYYLVPNLISAKRKSAKNRQHATDKDEEQFFTVGTILQLGISMFFFTIIQANYYYINQKSVTTQYRNKQ
ncbi:hypothetical protein CLV42_10889 [Chitinophaga ginsengisoli]|uniref:Uncharacterized protein n=1 Tax=Chitinophaga ginsengisoli TaxID=363837 RepID=A0A2P8G2G3_9BACT|nr:hypothetical protein CLV42_10889 [Chitinophaga ginsengisoli]